jgi:hypothetical protein
MYISLTELVTDQMAFAITFTQYFVVLLPVAVSAYIGYRIARSSLTRDAKGAFLSGATFYLIALLILSNVDAAVAQLFVGSHKGSELSQHAVIAMGFIWILVGTLFIISGLVEWVLTTHAVRKAVKVEDTNLPITENVTIGR